MTLVVGILGLVSVYAVVGLLFGVWFVFGGVAKLDRNAFHAPLGFRMLILPAAVALWPLLIHKLMVATRSAE